MKRILIALLVIQSVNLYAQDQNEPDSIADNNAAFKRGVKSQFGHDPNKTGGDVYGSFFGLIDVKSGKPGFGMNVGYAPVKYFGFGATAEGVQLESFNTKSKIGVNTVGEIRFFTPFKMVKPSFAFQYGILNYSDGLRTSTPRYISQIDLKGKRVLGANFNMCLSKNRKGSGVSISYSFRSTKFESDIKTTIISVSGTGAHATTTNTTTSTTGETHLITLGYNF